ncbi:MAG TPA: hypothetical protein VGI21_10515 [Streptosporangiaceae bacterium]
MTSAGYLRYPHLHEELLTFVADDDVWLAPAAGGQAWRLSAEGAAVSYPRISPDGRQVAWTTSRDRASEVYVTGVDGTGYRRLTWWGDAKTRVAGWTGDGEILAISAAGQPAAFLTWAFAIPLTGEPPRRLELGPASDLAVTKGVTALLTSSQHEPARWKRYRGGTSGRIWVKANGAPSFTRILGDLPTQLTSPMLIGDRLVFLSDHEGTGNLYSCALDGTGLRRHTDHDGFYARNPSTDGQRIVYHVAGQIWLLEDLGSQARRPELTAASPSTARVPRLISADDHLGSISCDQTGRASVVEVRGTVHWLTHRDGPARALFVDPAARARCPVVLGPDGGAAWISDATGRDALEFLLSPDAPEPSRLAEGQLGSVVGLAAAPDGTAVAAAASDGRLFLGAAVRHRDRAGRLRRRDLRRPGLVAGLDLAGLVAAGAAAAAPDPDRPPRRHGGLRRHRRPVRRHQPGVHPGRPLPGLFVQARLRPGVRRALLRPVVPVRQPPLPGDAVGQYPVPVRAAARGPAG